MDWFVKAFLKSSLVWLTLGVTFGFAMAAHPVWTVHRPAHMHMLLLGFVTMMIFGLKSTINCTWRSVMPPDTGITVQPSFSAP